MVIAKGKGDASTSNSNPNTNDAANPAQTEKIESSPMKMNVEEIVDKEEKAIEEVKNEENAIVVMQNEENAIEEEKNEENAIEEEESNEQVAIEEEENEDNAIVEEMNEGKVEADSKEIINKSRKRSRKKKAARRGSDVVVGKDKNKRESLIKNKAKDKDKPESSGKKKAKDKDNPESLGKKKASKKAESMGMIFMCSSKTKKDCYRYKVLGLPASKRDIVQKVYKGMRLFLFDFDLRLMYGIYKAAGPGGNNIEPKAFKSAFPSQVRFTVLEDCLPLAEEKFRTVIKDNYYTRNKFNCQLTSEQVKNLCKLFLAASKGPKSKTLGRILRAEPHHTFVDRARITRQALDEERCSALGGDRRRALDEERRSALGGVRRYRERPVMYEREAFPNSVVPLPRVPPLPPTAPAPSYAYERTLEMDGYRQDPLFEHRERRLLDLEQRRRDEIEYRDPYISYREPPLYRDPLYSAGLPPEYHHPGGPVSEYHPLAGPPSEYHLAAVLPPEYNPIRPLYRY